jgi:hypothetical protein
MCRSDRFRWIVGGTCLVVAGAVLLSPTPRPAVGDVPPLPRALNPVGDRLDGLIAAVLRKAALKEAVVAEVIAGRLSLVEGAARFREIETRCPDLERVYRLALRLYYSDCDYEVAVARNLVAVARQRLADDPAADPAVQPRLEGELAVLARRLLLVARG